jgi:hypothetical protein
LIPVRRREGRKVGRSVLEPSKTKTGSTRPSTKVSHQRSPHLPGKGLPPPLAKHSLQETQLWYIYRDGYQSAVAVTLANDNPVVYRAHSQAATRYSGIPHPKNFFFLRWHLSVLPKLM